MFLAKQSLVFNIVALVLCMEPHMEVFKGGDTSRHNLQAFQCLSLLGDSGLHMPNKRTRVQSVTESAYLISALKSSPILWKKNKINEKDIVHRNTSLQASNPQAMGLVGCGDYEEERINV